MGGNCSCFFSRRTHKKARKIYEKGEMFSDDFEIVHRVELVD
jgi:hypothetical protein